MINKVKHYCTEKNIKLTIRFVLGGVFIVAGISKFIDPKLLIAQFGKAGISNVTAGHIFAYTLIAFEVIIGLLLIFYFRQWVLLTTGATLTLFCIFLTYLIITHDPATCGCFGNFLHFSNKQELSNNLVLLLGALYIFNVPAMEFKTKEMIKLISMCTIAFGLIAVNGKSILHAQKDYREHDVIKRQDIEPSTFYNSTFPETVFYVSAQESMKLPDNRNYLLLGINDDVESTIKMAQSYIYSLKNDSNLIKVLLVTNNKKIFKDYGDEILLYDSRKLNEFYSISDDKNYTLFIDTNKITKFFIYQIIDGREFSYLIKKVKKGRK